MAPPHREIADAVPARLIGGCLALMVGAPANDRSE
jgi:hypothetical protein